MRAALLRVALLMAALLISCESAPFRPYDEVRMDGLDPAAVLAEFRSSTPKSMSLLNSLTFKYNHFYKISALGSIHADLATGRFSVVLVSPAGGVKLMEVSAGPEGVYDKYAIGPMSEKADFAKAVADDIRRIYFDLLPSADARLGLGRYAHTYKESVGKGDIVYVFRGGPYLAEKKYYEQGEIVWKASYYEYRGEGGMLYPGGVVFINYKYGYSLTARLLEIYEG